MIDLRNDTALTALLTRHGLTDGGPIHGVPLTGGVSSQVIRVDVGDRSLVVKRPLAELTVGNGWRADIRRALTEARFARTLTELVPGSVPSIVAVDEESHTLVMMCAPDGSRPWKQDLLDGVINHSTAERVGALFGQIHGGSTHQSGTAAKFSDRTHFETLRVAPYLRHVQHRHPDLAEPLEHCLGLVTQPGRCLVHGDASPKNLLVTPDDDVLVIDHEVAHWGNPAFDTAFLVNHLCLKAVSRPQHATELLDAARLLMRTYTNHSGGSGATADDTALLLPALLLARIDGRSPVEYLDNDQRVAVRRLAVQLLHDTPDLDSCLRTVHTYTVKGRS